MNQTDYYITSSHVKETMNAQLTSINVRTRVVELRFDTGDSIFEIDSHPTKNLQEFKDSINWYARRIGKNFRISPESKMI